MRKTKKLLSMLTALALTASSFAALTVPASAEQLYKMDLAAVTAGDVTKKAQQESELANLSVEDFGTGTEQTTAVTALDGWGYMHWGATGGNFQATGRQTAASVEPTTNTFYVYGVGTSGCNGAISFIPENVDTFSKPSTGVLVYKTTVLAKNNGATGTPTVGFTKGTGKAPNTVGKAVNVDVLAATKDEATSYNMVFVQNVEDGAYSIYKNGILESNGTDTEIKGIYGQTPSNKNLAVGFKDLTVDSETAAPADYTIEFVNGAQENASIQKYEHVLEGTVLTIPDAPIVAGKTFSHWEKDGTQVEGTTVTVGTAGATYTAVYTEGSTLASVTAETERYAKITVTPDGETPVVVYAGVDGKADLGQIKKGSITYKVEKEGYTAAEGTETLGDEGYKITAKPTLNSDYLYYESEFGNADGHFGIVDRGRNEEISLGTVALGTLSTLSLDINSAANPDGQYTVGVRDSSGKIIVGVQGTAEGLYAFTNWSGNSDYNQESDAGKYTNGVKIADSWSGKHTVDFVIDKTNMAITVSCGDMKGSLTLENSNDPANIKVGKYQYKGSIYVETIKVTKPDENFVSVGGDAKFAKIAGKTVTREYTASPGVPVPGETFTWTMEPATVTGVSIGADTGILSVTDEAAADTEVTLTATSSTADTKKGSIKVTIADFQDITLTADGPKAYHNNAGAKGKYEILSATDGCDDEVKDIMPDPVWSSSNTDAATIDAETGELTVVDKGTTTVTATVMNGTKVSKIDIPVVVDNFYIDGNVEGGAASTDVDIKDIAVADKYLVTTADADKKLVKQTEVAAPEGIGPSITKTVAAEAGVKLTATYENGKLTNLAAPIPVAADEEIDLTPANANTKVFFWKSLASMEPAKTETQTEGATGSTSITIDTTGAATYEIAPVFSAPAAGIKAADERYTFNVPADTYNLTVKMTGSRADVYANEQLLINNMLQYGTTPDTDEAHDIYIKEGYAKINTRDYSSGKSAGDSPISAITLVKAPSNVARTPKVYVLGDSLVAKYYNADKSYEKLDGETDEQQQARFGNMTGWGQVLQHYLNDTVEVIDLANSGADSLGLNSTAITQVVESAQEGDIMVLESGYNDKGHSVGVDNMKAAVTDMYNKAKAKGVEVVITSPNSSSKGSDYSPTVAWTTDMKAVADTLTEAVYIDLAKLSYEFAHDTCGYGDTYNSTDKYSHFYHVYSSTEQGLHSTFYFANVCAAIVAGEMSRSDNLAISGVVNMDAKFEFKDPDGATVKLQPNAITFTAAE